MIKRGRPGSRWWSCCWWCLALLSLLTAIYGLSVLQYGVPQGLQPSYEVRPSWFRIHIAAGTIALVLGILQFHAGLRRGLLSWHRRSGLVYLGAVCVSGVAGFTLSFSVATGAPADWGFRLLAIVWVPVTVMAYQRIVVGDVFGHRRWMIRSYALTLAAVTLRIELITGLILTGGAFELVYPIIAYACWIPNLVIAEVWIRLSNRATRAPAPST